MTATKLSYLTFFPNLSDEQIQLLEKAEKLYLEWNEKINVISRKDTEHIREHHFLHSLAIAKFANFEARATVLDVGTGGGFPGIPLAIYFPDVEFILVDSIQKKVSVVKEIAGALGLKNVKGMCSRVEDLTLKPDYILSRAVKRLNIFLPWVDSCFTNKQFKGLFYLKGGDLKEEIQEVSNRYKIIQHALIEKMQIPFFDQKYVLHVQKK